MILQIQLNHKKLISLEGKAGVENQQTQPTYSGASGNRVWATLVEAKTNALTTWRTLLSKLACVAVCFAF